MEHPEKKNQSAAQEPQGEHRLLLENRSGLQLTGVQEVTAYDAYTVTMETVCGTLLVGGSGMRVQSFSAQTGEALLTGEVEYLQYQSRIRREKGKGALHRLFGG